MTQQGINTDAAPSEGASNRREEARTSLILLVLRVALMAAAAIAIAWPLTTSIGWVCCGIGAGGGVLLGSYLGRSAVRHWAVVVGACLGFLLCIAIAEQLVAWDWVVSIIGGSGALELSEATLWGGGALVLLALLRASAHRYATLGVLELVLPLLAAASLFSAHRGGNIHRPQQLVDFALERGQDPTWYLQLLGVLGALFLAVGLLRLRRGIQIFGGIALIALLMLGMLVLSANVPKSAFLSMQKRFGKDGKEKAKAKAAAGKGKGTKGKPRKGKMTKGQRQKRQKGQQRQNGKQKYMQFRSQRRQKQNRNRLVGVVLFKNDYTPPSGVYYFRQRAMSQFNGARMVAASRADVDLDQVDHFPILNTQLKVAPPIKLPKDISGLKASPPITGTLPKRLPLLDNQPTKGQTPSSKERAAILGLLKLLKEAQSKKRQQMRLQKVTTIVSLMHDHSNPFGLATPLSYRGLPNPSPRVFLRSYQVRSLALTGRLYPRFQIKSVAQLPALLLRDFPMRSHEVGEAWWPKDVLAYYTKPPDDPRYKALLEKILAPLAGHEELSKQTLAKAFAIKRWLEHNAAYSMQLKAPEHVRDHVAHFLFDRRIGYCVHFSHAAVYLMRMVGVPARVAEGYAIPARERGSGSSLLIKVGAAHAWPEIYLRGLGWVPFDIYPKKNLDAQRPRPPDPKQRQMLANLARPKKIPPLKKSKGARESRKDFSALWKFLGAIARFPWYWLPVALLVILLGGKWWRRYAYLWAAKDRRLLMFYRSFEDRLSELGIRREAGETLEAFSDSLREGMPTLHVLLGQLSALHLGSRLAAAEPDPAHVKALLQEYRAHFPWYRRWVRMLDPVSWSIHVLHRWRYMPPAWWVAWLVHWERINQSLNRILFLFRRAR